MKAVIIGGGVAGLAAGYELVKSNHEVVIIEAGPILGGQVRTFEIGGQQIESFYHHLFKSDVTIIELINELGLGDDLVWHDSSTAINTDNKIYPFASPFDLLKFDQVSFITRLRLGFAALWLRKNSNWQKYEGLKAQDWIISKVGHDGYEKVWEPLLSAKFGKYASEVSMAWFWGKIYLRFASRDSGVLGGEQLGYLRGSFGRLVTALADEIISLGGEIKKSMPVDDILIDNGKVSGVNVLEENEVVKISADAVIATIPSGIFAKLTPEIASLDQEYFEKLSRVKYQWASVLVLVLDRPLSEYYWMTMTDKDCPFVVTVEHTNFVSSQEYDGKHIVYFSNYTDPQDPILDFSPDELLETYIPYIKRINTEFMSSWILEKWLFVDRAGQPIVHSLYHKDIVSHQSPIQGLYLANTTQIYPEDRGQNYSIRMGQRVAELINQQIN
ncbi:MAG: amine oxidase [Chloroflexi bacterium]|nr:amine oxidase [Chloroflexota bacterium]|tara:strand:- start:2826 stop:4154 length:1329 start_codon:yes stop_codon:yes gene_type:complete